jgi:hypothetical protein
MKRAFQAMAAIVAAGMLLTLGGCAATYVMPTIHAPDTSMSIQGSQASLMAAATQALTVDGFDITSSDAAAGTISTAPRALHLTPADASCGTTMGLDYLKDNRTSTTVAYGVIVKPNSVRVVATMSGTYLPSNDVQSITLTCISRGVLEHKLLDQIAQLAH